MRVARSLGGDLAAVRGGSMTFARFASRNARAIAAQSANLFRRYRLPAWVSVDDVSQALLFEIWRALPAYDERAAGGRGLEWFVMVRATLYTDKALNKWRNSLRRSTRNQSRIEVPIGEGGDVYSKEAAAAALASPSPTIDAVLLSEILDALSEERDRIAAEAVCVCGGHLADAAHLLLETPDVAVAFGLRNFDDARSMVGRVVSLMRAVA